MVRKILQIGYLNPFKKFGGVEKYIQNLSKSMNELYHVEVDVLCADNISGILKSEYGNIIHFKVPFFGKGNLLFISKLYYGFLVSGYLSSHFKDYDIIHFHGDNGIIWTKFSDRSVLTLHGISKNISSLKERIISFIPAMIEKNNAKRARTIFSVSREAKDFFGNYVAGIEVIKPSIDTSLFCPPTNSDKIKAREKLGISAGEIIGSITGRDWKRKGLDIAISAIERVKDPRIHLVAIGFPDVKHADTKVKVTGNIDEETKRYFLVASDFFIFPSYKEGFPIAVLEAAGCGLPLIVSKQSGVSELAPIVPFYQEVYSRSPDEYARALIEFLKFYSEGGLSNYAYNLNALDQYSIKNTVTKYMKAYTDIERMNGSLSSL